MSAGWESRLLRLMRVPPEPQPPSGSPGSLRVFRAGRNYLWLRLTLWLGAQSGAVFGVLVSLTFIREAEMQIDHQRNRAVQAAAADPAAERADADVGVDAGTNPSSPDASEPELKRGPLHQFLYDIAPRGAREAAAHVPERLLFWIKIGEAVALLGFVVQLGASFGVVLIDYRQRWYMVTDRSLRLRSGVWNVHESTMSFANLQQVAVHQGPLERLLGLWDVEVESAGGGGGRDEDKNKESLHRCVFHGVEDGAEIRDIILARLKHFREAGLGDPDDAPSVIGGGDGLPQSPADDPARAARAVLEEIRALRQLLR